MVEGRSLRSETKLAWTIEKLYSRHNVLGPNTFTTDKEIAYTLEMYLDSLGYLIRYLCGMTVFGNAGMPYNILRSGTPGPSQHLPVPSINFSARQDFRLANNLFT